MSGIFYSVFARSVTMPLLGGILFLGLSACTSGSSIDDGSSSLDVSDSSFSGTTNGSGAVSFEFSIPPGAVSFQLSLQSGGNVGSIALTAPSGESILSSSSEVGRWSSSDVSSPYVVNYPYLSAPVPAGTYRVSYNLVTGRNQDPLAGADTRLSVAWKQDSDLNNGTLRVNLVLVGPVSDSEDTSDGLENALDVMKQIYSRAGVSIDPAWYNFSGPGTLPDPRSNSDFYGDIVTGTRSDAVNIVFGADVDGLGSGEQEFGRTGSIPSPVQPSNKGVVAISILEITGRDGRFDYEDEPGATERHNDERRLAGEEMARLTARFLGLENLVELSGNSVVRSDSLSDSPSCLTLTGCRSTKEARNNFMFPFPLKEFDNNKSDESEYYARDNVTDQQRQVINRNVLVD